MIFADNCLQLVHEHGFGVEFTTLDALKCVRSEQDVVQVADAKEWKEARSLFPTFHFMSEAVQNVVINNDDSSIQ